MVYWISIDVSKAQLDGHIRLTAEAFQVPNTELGIAALVERLQSLCPTLVVMEATGGLEAPAAPALVIAQLPVAVVNPRQVRVGDPFVQLGITADLGCLLYKLSSGLTLLETTGSKAANTSKASNVRI